MWFTVPRLDVNQLALAPDQSPASTSFSDWFSRQHDPNRPEDVLKVNADEDGVGGDDAADALRYLVATKARTVVQRKLCGV